MNFRSIGNGKKKNGRQSYGKNHKTYNSTIVPSHFDMSESQGEHSYGSGGLLGNSDSYNAIKTPPGGDDNKARSRSRRRKRNAVGGDIGDCRNTQQQQQEKSPPIPRKNNNRQRERHDANSTTSALNQIHQNNEQMINKHRNTARQYSSSTRKGHLFKEAAEKVSSSLFNTVSKFSATKTGPIGNIIHNKLGMASTQSRKAKAKENERRQQIQKQSPTRYRLNLDESDSDVEIIDDADKGDASFHRQPKKQRQHRQQQQSHQGSKVEELEKSSSDSPLLTNHLGAQQQGKGTINAKPASKDDVGEFDDDGFYADSGGNRMFSSPKKGSFHKQNNNAKIVIDNNNDDDSTSSCESNSRSKTRKSVTENFSFGYKEENSHNDSKKKRKISHPVGNRVGLKTQLCSEIVEVDDENETRNEMEANTAANNKKYAAQSKRTPHTKKGGSSGAVEEVLDAISKEPRDEYEVSHAVSCQVEACDNPGVVAAMLQSDGQSDGPLTEEVAHRRSIRLRETVDIEKDVDDLFPTKSTDGSRQPSRNGNGGCNNKIKTEFTLSKVNFKKGKKERKVIKPGLASGFNCNSDIGTARSQRLKSANTSEHPVVDDPIEESELSQSPEDVTMRHQRRNQRKAKKASTIKNHNDDGGDEFEWNDTSSTKQNGVDPSRFYSTGSQSSSACKNTRRRSTRSTRKMSKQESELIEISDSSDDESTLTNTPEKRQVGATRGDKSPRLLQHFVLDVVRIAIGKKVFNSSCKLSLERTIKTNECCLTLSYAMKKNKKMEHKIKCDVDSITEIKYYIADDDDISADDGEDTAGGNSGIMGIEAGKSSLKSGLEALETKDSYDETEHVSFLALRVTPNEDNKLARMTSAYLQKPKEGNSDTDERKEFIVIEVREDDELNDLLQKMKKSNDDLKALLVGSKVTKPMIGKYASSLIEEGKKEKKRRESSLGSPICTRTRSGGVKQERIKLLKDDEVVLVYPCGITSQDQYTTVNECLSRACGLHFILKEDVAGLGSIDCSSNGKCDSDDTDSSTEKENKDNFTQEAPSSDINDNKVKERRHVLTVRGEDYNRLSPGEFLNDTLIDFWMQWIWRKEQKSLRSQRAHFFTSHFYTTLEDEGPGGVTSWTAKKDINIFEKKFIFIPVNKCLHWSLCVVVNPGLIDNNISDKSTGDEPHSFMFFFDSLKAHRKNKVAADVRNWLNSEWKRLGKRQYHSQRTNKEIGPFQKSTIKTYDPKVPYQDNSCDCGVFVCRYALGVYSLFDYNFTFADVNEKGRPFTSAITNSKQFLFNMDDIAAMRVDMRALLDFLSKIYKEWKRDEDEKEREEKRARKMAKVEAVKKTIPVSLHSASF